MNTGIILCIILLGSILPAVGSGQTNTTIEDNYDTAFEKTNTIVHPLGYFGPNIYLMGRIEPLDYDAVFENYTYFFAVRVRGIQIYWYDGSHAIELFQYRNIPVFFHNDYYQFRGILEDRFICGVFEFIYSE